MLTELHLSYLTTELKFNLMTSNKKYRRFTTKQLSQFLILYYTGKYEGERLGQAFMNHVYSICDIKIMHLFTEKSDKKCIQIILENFIDED